MDPKDDDLVSLKVIAAELSTTPKALRRLARAGEFPQILKVTSKHFMVSQHAYECWKIERWISRRNGGGAIVTDVPTPTRRKRNRAAAVK